MKFNGTLLFMAASIISLPQLSAKSKKIKCLNVNQLHVCGNETVDGNLTVNGTETVNGKLTANNSLAVSGALTLNGQAITSSTTMAYGSFYSNANLTAPSAITLTPGVTFPAGSFTPFNNGTGTGVTVRNAGTYLVWFSLLANNDGTEWQLNTPAGLVPGSNVDNGTDNTFANGFAAVTVNAGDFIIITGNDTTGTAGDGSQTVLLTLLRVK